MVWSGYGGSKPAFRRKDIWRSSRRPLENGYSDAGGCKEAGCTECKWRRACSIYCWFRIQCCRYVKRRDQSDWRGLCKDRDTSCIQQQCTPLDTGCTDGSTGDQCRAFWSDQRSEKASRNNPWIYRSKAELFHPELCTVPCCMERVWTKRAGCYDLSGNFRSR